MSSKLEHLVVPVLAAIDWIFVGRNSTRLQWWWPLVWLVGPVVYLSFCTAATHQRGRPLYPFLDPDSGDFWVVAVGVLVGFALLGYLLWAIGRLSGHIVLARPGPRPG
ncbi:MAG: Pr6Pr family membrane protein [Nakamurella sp.]